MVTAQEHAALVERVGRLEKWMGSPGETPSLNINVFQRIREAETTLEGIRSTVEILGKSSADLPSFVESRIVSCEEELNNLTQAIDIKVEGILDELVVMKRALRNVDERPTPKVKVPEPKPFEGARSSKELENFLWDMENYFKASHIPENEKVSITSMYLAGDAKLWWRSRVSNDETMGREVINTWETLRKELKEQFLPCNTSFMARRALRELKHSGSVHEYVKEFSSLLLDVKDMSEEDKLFNFLAGLQTWAQAELRRQGVKDLQSAIAAADGLIDFRVVGVVESMGSSKIGDSRKNGKGKGKEKSSRPVIVEVSDSGESSHTTAEKQKKRGCYHCGGDHLKRNCPKLKGKLNALVSEVDDAESGTHRCNPLQLVNALVVEEDEVQRDLLESLKRCRAFKKSQEKKGGYSVKSKDDGGSGTTRTSSSLGPAGLLDP